MQTALTIIHVIICIILIGVVLMQHGKQQGLSGAIAGGAETFFGKNKGRTIDGVLRKVTTVVAALFVISAVVFAAYSASQLPDTTKDEGQQVEATMDTEGNLVDAEGNILMTAEDMAAAQTEANAEGDAEAETETAE